MNNGSYRRYDFEGIKGQKYAFANITDGCLSAMLDNLVAAKVSILFLCGTLEQMTLEYVMEPVESARIKWELSRKYIHKFRSPSYTDGQTIINVKLIGESWLPGVTDASTAYLAFNALEDDWKRTTGLPLLSTPSKTGQAFLHKKFPKGAIYPKLEDKLAMHIRNISPQHRIEKIDHKPFCDADNTLEECPLMNEGNGFHKYDGRWMYAALCYLDRLPVGEPKYTTDFAPYTPGWYKVSFKIPHTWNHIGIIPVKLTDDFGNHKWFYPNEPDLLVSDVWVSEPELGLAMANGWEVSIWEGWQFSKGRPLTEWRNALVEMRTALELVDVYAARAVREILNHTIGSFHRDDYEREITVNAQEWKALDKSTVTSWESLDSGMKRVQVRVKHQDKISIYMPHWSAQIYALERAKITEHALRCNPATLVEIRGDAIYSTVELPFTDNGNLGQIRYQGLEVLK